MFKIGKCIENLFWKGLICSRLFGHRSQKEEIAFSVISRFKCFFILTTVQVLPSWNGFFFSYFLDHSSLDLLCLRLNVRVLQYNTATLLPAFTQAITFSPGAFLSIWCNVTIWTTALPHTTHTSPDSDHSVGEGGELLVYCVTYIISGRGNPHHPTLMVKHHIFTLFKSCSLP